MKLIKETKAKCEMGACRKRADYSIRMERIGIKSKICICHDCLNELYALLGETLVPKSFETVKKKGVNY